MLRVIWVEIQSVTPGTRIFSLSSLDPQNLFGTPTGNLKNEGVPMTLLKIYRKPRNMQLL